MRELLALLRVIFTLQFLLNFALAQFHDRSDLLQLRSTSLGCPGFSLVRRQIAHAQQGGHLGPSDTELTP
jgi:hypothetical protein